MQSKLDKLVTSSDFGKGAINMDTGIVVYEKTPLNYVMLTHANHHEVYLSLFDEEPPYDRDHLIHTKAKTIESAQRKAEKKLKRILKTQ